MSAGTGNHLHGFDVKPFPFWRGRHQWEWRRHQILWCKNLREPSSGTRDRDIPMNSDRSLGSTTSQKVASSIVSRGARCCKTNFCWGTCSSNPHDPPGYSHPPTCSSQWFTWSYFLHWFLSMLWSKTMVITCVLWIVEAPPNKKRKGKQKDKKKNEKDKNDWVTYYGYASKSSNRGGHFLEVYMYCTHIIIRSITCSMTRGGLRWWSENVAWVMYF